MLVVADNVLAARALCADFSGKIRGIYIDPPYNSGRTFDAYDDARSPEEWLRELHERLPIFRALLAEDGTLVAQIDDTELASLTLALDHVFGRTQRIATVTVVRSAATGHKAKNRGPVNVSDYLLFYAKDRKRVRLNAQQRVRAGMDPAYALAITNPEAAPAEYAFTPLRAHVAHAHGHPRAHEAIRKMGKESFDRVVAAWALENAHAVVRFAQPRYEAIAKDLQRAVDISKKDPLRVFVVERGRHKKMILRGGNSPPFFGGQSRARERREPGRRAADDGMERHAVSRNRARGRRHVRAQQEAGAPPPAHPFHDHGPGRLGARPVPRKWYDSRGGAEDGAAMDWHRARRARDPHGA